MKRGFVKWGLLIVLALLGVRAESALPDLLPYGLDHYVFLAILIVFALHILFPTFDRMWPKPQKGPIE